MVTFHSFFLKEIPFQKPNQQTKHW
jgi:hypothetical protein